MQTTMGATVLAVLLAGACTSHHTVGWHRPLPGDHVSRGSGAVEGALIGGLLGLAGGAAMAGADECDPSAVARCDGSGMVLGFGTASALTGAVVGALVGHRHRYHRPAGRARHRATEDLFILVPEGTEILVLPPASPGGTRGAEPGDQAPGQTAPRR